MIRFGCPRCNSVLTQPESALGTLFTCPGCGQKLQVPRPPDSQDPSASPVPNNPPVSAGPVPAPSATKPDPAPPVASPNWPPIPFAAESRVPAGKKSQDATNEDEPRKSQRASLPYARHDWDENEDDDSDDVPSITRTSGRRGRFTRETAAKAASTGLVFSLIALGLLVITFVVWVAASRGMRARGVERQPLVVIALLVVFGSFVLSIAGIVFSTRGLDESNTYNRGQATAGLVFSIISLVIASLIGLFLLCVGMMFALPGRW